MSDAGDAGGAFALFEPTDGRLDVTDSYANDAREALDLLTSARCVLFDFDGPVCRLFAGHPSPEVARRLLAWLPPYAARAVHRPAGPPTDPQVILRELGRRYPGSELVGELEGRLTAEEIQAAGSAAPTRNADVLIRGLSAAGTVLAVTTNNAAVAVERYLAREGLADCFGGHIYGRTPDPRLLKPNPHCLAEALIRTGSTADESVMIGDTPVDLEAAKRLGVPFVGFGRNAFTRRRLDDAGAGTIIGELPHHLGEVAARDDQLAEDVRQQP